jgi:large subunit ribosomal protein L25
MKKAQLSGSLRTNVGKVDSKATRNAGRVPCVLYGSGEQTHFSVRSIDMEKIIFSPDVYQIELDLDGTKKMAIIQEKQMHPVTDKPRHVDFLELEDTKPVKVSLPVRTTGAAIGVMNGGRLRQNYRMLKLFGLPGDLPESVTIDITKMKIGHSVRVKGLAIPNVTILEPAEAVIVGVKMARGAVATGSVGDDDDEATEEATSDAETETTIDEAGE